MINQPKIDPSRPQPTGRRLVFFRPQMDFAAVKGALQRTVGINTLELSRIQRQYRRNGRNPI